MTAAGRRRMASGVPLFPYWLLFGSWALGAIQYSRRDSEALNRPLFIALAISTALLIGLRDRVGGDWPTYLQMFIDMSYQSLSGALTFTDPGYAFFNWLGFKVGGGVWIPNLICATIFVAGLGRLAQRQPNPWLAVLVAIPYLAIVVAMGYTRQAAAIGIICWIVADASNRNVARQILLIGIATLFHKTAILFLPILLVPIFLRSFVLGVFGTIAFAVIFSFALGQSSDQLITNYVSSSYNSQGAGIRLSMNVLAGVLMLMFRQRLALSQYQESFWTICAILALISPIVLVVVSASSGVDRLTLFLIPLQVLVFARLPYAFTTDDRALPSAVLGVITYSFLVQYVWLNYADNAQAWLPYRTLLIKS